MSSWMLVRFISTAPQWELPSIHFKKIFVDYCMMVRVDNVNFFEEEDYRSCSIENAGKLLGPDRVLESPKFQIQSVAYSLP